MWQVLQKNGEVAISKLQNMLKEIDAMTHQALDWPAREGVRGQAVRARPVIGSGGTPSRSNKRWKRFEDPADLFVDQQTDVTQVRGRANRERMAMSDTPALSYIGLRCQDVFRLARRSDATTQPLTTKRKGDESNVNPANRDLDSDIVGRRWLGLLPLAPVASAGEGELEGRA